MNTNLKQLVALGHGAALLFTATVDVSAFNPSAGRGLNRDPIEDKAFVAQLGLGVTEG